MRDLVNKGKSNRTVTGTPPAAATSATQRDYFLPAFVLLIVFSWAILWLWDHSRYGTYLDHGHWSENGLTAGICRAVPGGDILVPAFLYVSGWLLMSAAMMLPTILPLLSIFRRVTFRRTDRRFLLSLVIGGYLVIWGSFGVLAHTLNWAILELVQGSIWLATNSWIPAAFIFLLAGIFQFSALKYRCLDKCRSPLTFVMQHWRGRHEYRRSFRLGMHHGVYCVGCCWALMLIMFAVGTSGLGWMLALGAVMAVEKNTSWGRKISAPVGIFLLSVSGVILGRAMSNV